MLPSLSLHFAQEAYSGRAFRYIFFAENFGSKERFGKQKRMPLQSLSQNHIFQFPVFFETIEEGIERK